MKKKQSELESERCNIRGEREEKRDESSGSINCFEGHASVTL